MPHRSLRPPCSCREGLSRCKCWAWEKACLAGLVMDSFLSKLVNDLFPFQRLLTRKAGAGGTFPSPAAQVGTRPSQWPQPPESPRPQQRLPRWYLRFGGELGGWWWWS